MFVPLLDEKENRRFQEEVPVYVPKWLMFKELMLVLQASLQDIVDRWVSCTASLPGCPGWAAWSRECRRGKLV